MSTRAKALRDLTPVSAEHRKREGLLPGWKFFHAPRGAGLACSLCGCPADYAAAPSGMLRCTKHARDF